jgi:formylglycine-generating enzyme required for sulfatase activity
MGSPTNEVGRSADEGPQTVVAISRGFWIGRYLITQSQFTNVMGPWNFAFTGVDLPAESLSWADAVNYCTVLTDTERQGGRLPTGYVYRLPTEAEWEYAARAGTTTRYYFGDDPTGTVLPEYAWYSLNSNGQTHPAGSKLPNAWGLYDVSGNVQEWCRDYYAATLPGGMVTDPVGPNSGSTKILRGGNFLSSANQLRSASRGTYFTATSGTGFRMVLGPQLP